jgi:transposase InsO family protein
MLNGAALGTPQAYPGNYTAIVVSQLDHNAVAETFFATLKKELVNRRAWPDRLELQSATFEYIEAFYNRQRRRSTLKMLSPVNYEQLRLSPLGG